jgi:hypothetical protein
MLELSLSMDLFILQTLVLLVFLRQLYRVLTDHLWWVSGRGCQ